MEHLRRHRLTLLLVLLPIIPLFLVLFAGHTIGPWDDVRAVTLGEGPITKGWDILMVDACLQFTPWRKLVLESWAQGQIPFLNPYALWGQPLLANGQSGALYPLHILFGVLRVPLAAALTLLAWFHLAWAGLGTRFWARALGASEEGGFIAGAIVTLSAFFLLWTPLPSVITTCAWIPWVLGLVTVLARGEGSRRQIGLLGLSVAMMILGGHLQFVAFGLMAAAVTGVYWLAVDRRWSVVLPLFGAVVLGVLIAMPHLGPVLAFSSESHRRGAPTADGFSSYQASAIQPYEYLSIVDNRMLGTPRSPERVQGIPVPMPGSWVQYAKPGGHPAESAIAVGPLCLALLAGWRRGKTGVNGAGGALACVGGLGLLIALGTPFNALLYYGVPGWSSTGSPGRAAVLFVLAAAVGAGLAWKVTEEELDEDPGKRLKVPMLVGIVSFILAFVGLSFFPSPSSWLPQVPSLDAMQFRAANAYLIPGAMAGSWASFVFLFSKQKTKRFMLPIAVASIAISSFGLTVTSPVGIPDKSPWPELADPNNRVAFITPSWPLPGPPIRALGMPNITTLFAIPSASVYDSLLTGGDVARFSEFTQQDSPFPPTNGNMLVIKELSANPASNGITHVVDSRDPNGSVLALERPGSGSRITQLDTGGLAIEVTAGQPVEAFFFYRPGMTATINGKPFALQAGNWITSSTPPAESGTLRVNYVPPGFSNLLLLGVFGLIAALALCFLPTRSEGESDNSGSMELE